MPYGTADGVAAYAKPYATGGHFYDADCLTCLVDEETNPTLSEVNNWLTQLSNTLDVVLAGEGFTVPITETKCVSMITAMIEQMVGDLVQAANGCGRFFTNRAQEFGAVPMMVIRKELVAWANDNASNLAAAGAARGASARDEIATKENTPIFSREAFGNVFDVWKED